jgi:hypothetical protein
MGDKIMNEIKININCEGGYCGRCCLQKYYPPGNMTCRVFPGAMQADKDKGYRRLPLCLAADINQDALYFKKKYNVHLHNDSDNRCCGNCQNFTFDKASQTYRFTDIKTHTTKDVQLGICELAKQEGNPIIDNMPDSVCDAHTMRECMALSEQTETTGEILEETKTLDEWAKLDGITILDPDGFDRTDHHLWERQFTKAEYDKGLCNCTIRCNVNVLNREGKNGG